LYRYAAAQQHSETVGYGPAFRWSHYFWKELLKAGLCRLNPADPQLDRTRFQPLSLYIDISWYQAFAFKCNVCRYVKGWQSAKVQEIDIKNLMQNLVTDMLTTLNMPEWPVAGLMLLSLCAQLLSSHGINSSEIRCAHVFWDFLLVEGLINPTLQQPIICL
jgi:hypothetical protein